MEIQLSSLKAMKKIQGMDINQLKTMPWMRAKMLKDEFKPDWFVSRLLNLWAVRGDLRPVRMVRRETWLRTACLPLDRAQMLESLDQHQHVNEDFRYLQAPLERFRAG